LRVKRSALMFAFSDDFGSLKPLAITPRPKGDQRSHDCDEIVGDRHRSEARRNANMKAKKGSRDADQGRREVAGACPKPATPIASNSQSGNDADKCHNERDGERGIARRLGRIARHMVAIDEDRKRLIELYASERLESRAYIEANRELDAKRARLTREKREIAAGVLPLDAETVLDTSIRAFCEDAKAKFNASADPDTRRAFLAGRIERIIYRKRHVTIVGAVPLPSSDEDEGRKAPFRIEAEIDIEAVKSRPRPTKPGDGRFRKWNPKYASASPAVSPALRPALVIGAEAAITL
jgi:hypothetical protein